VGSGLWGFVFGVSGLGFGVWVLGELTLDGSGGSGLRLRGLSAECSGGLEFGASGLGVRCGIWSVGCGVWGVGCEI